MYVSPVYQVEMLWLRCFVCVIWRSELSCLGSSLVRVLVRMRVLWVQIPPKAAHYLKMTAKSSQRPLEWFVLVHTCRLHVVSATLTLKRIASSARNLGKLLSLRALIRTRSSWISGFSLFNWPAITNTYVYWDAYVYMCMYEGYFITHWFNSSHAEIIVVLLRELLTAKLVHLCHLSGQVLGGFETLRVEDNLCNQCCVSRGEPVILPSSIVS